MKVFQIKNYKVIVILCIIIACIGFMVCFATENSQPLSGKIIVIDAGHGGIDPGANRPGIAEKDINLAIALHLKDILHNYGAKVILSRESDIDLSQNCDNPKVNGRYRRDLAARLEMVEESDADLFVSIHANVSSNTKRRGPESFYFAKSEASQSLANSIQAEFQVITNAIKQANPGDYFVLRRNKVAAALIEVGYITNPDERSLLQSREYQYKLAEAIAKGIYNYVLNTTTASYRNSLLPQLKTKLAF